MRVPTKLLVPNAASPLRVTNGGAEYFLGMTTHNLSHFFRYLSAGLIVAFQVVAHKGLLGFSPVSVVDGKIYQRSISITKIHGEA